MIRLLCCLLLGMLLPASATLPVITAQPQDTSIRPGETLTLSVTAEQFGPHTYRWRRNGIPIPGATGQTLTIPNAQFTDTGLYSVTVTSVAGYIRNSQNARVYVADTPLTCASWGDTGFNQTVVPAEAIDLIKIEAGTYHAVAMKRDGTMVTWGAIPNGTISIPANAGRIRDFSTSDLHTVAVRDDGTVIAWGNNDSGQCNVPPGLTDVVYVKAGISGNLAVRSNGTAVTFGGTGTANTLRPPPFIGANQAAVPLSAPNPTSAGVAFNDGTPHYWSSTAMESLPPEITSVVAQQTQYVLRADGVLFAPWRPNNKNLPQGLTYPRGFDWSFGTSIFLTSDSRIVTVGGTFWKDQVIPAGVDRAACVAMGSGTSYVIAPERPLTIITPPRSQGVRVGWTGATISVSATGTPLPSYQWRRNGVPIPGRNASELTFPNGYKATDDGAYDVVISNSRESITSEPVTLMAADPPVILVHPTDQPSLLGTTVTFTVQVQSTAPVTYTWRYWAEPLLGQQPPHIVVDGNRLTINGVTANEINSNFSVIVSNGAGTVTSNPGRPIVPPLPSIVTHPVNRIIGAGGTATFSVVVAANLQPPTYQWLRNGEPIPGAESASYTVTDGSPDSAGRYAVRLTNFAGTVTSNEATLTFAVPPVITTHPQPRLVPLNGSATFSVAATSVGTLSYQWRANGNIVGSNSSTLTLNPVTSQHFGDVTVAVTGPGGTTVSNPAQLRRLMPPVIVSPPQSTTAWLGDAASFSVTATGEGTLTYQWTRNGSPVGGSTPVLTINPVTSGSLGTYRVQVSNAAGSATSDFVQLALPPSPQFTQLPEPVSAAGGAPVILTAAATGGQPLLWQWRRNGVAIPGATEPTLRLPALTGSRSGDYTVVVSNPGGIRISRPVGVFVRDLATGVVAWGRNHRGQATPPTGLVGLRSVTAGDFHGLAVLLDGSVRAWGWNADGQGTVPTDLPPIVAAAAGNSHSIALLGNGTPRAWGWNGNGQTDVPATLTDAVAIAAGHSHSLALRSDGSVTAWGLNSAGQTTVPSGLARVVAIACGAFHSLALRDDGTVAAWGSNQLGQTNVPLGLADVVAIAAGDNHSMALTRTGQVFVWGDNDFEQRQVPAAALGATEIASGGSHAFARVPSGSLVAWGANESGQATVPPSSTMLAFDAGRDFSVAIQRRLPTGYDAWSAARSLPEGLARDPEADPDDDGSANVLEFVAGSDPLARESRPAFVPAASDTPESRVFSFLMRDDFTLSGAGPLHAEAAGLAVSVEASADLSTWTLPLVSIATPEGESLPPPPAGWSWRAVRVTAPSGRAWVRMRSTIP